MNCIIIIIILCSGNNYVTKEHIFSLNVEMNNKGILHCETLTAHSTRSYASVALQCKPYSCWLGTNEPVQYLHSLVFSELTVERLKSFIPQLLSRLHIEFLIYGNITKQVRRDRNVQSHLMVTRYGHRAFSCVAPTLWNAQPLDLRTQQDPSRFRRDLKTHLFNVAFLK